MHKYISLSILLTLSSLQSSQPTNKEPLPSKDISITISITKEMLGYTHKLFGTHYPEHFKIIINNQTYTIFDNDTLLSDKKTITIPVTGNSITASYGYSFAKGAYQGTDKPVEIPVLSDKHKNYTLQFDWRSTQRIQLNAVPIASKTAAP